MSGFENGTFCGDKRWRLSWLIVQAVYVAAWLSDPFNRRSPRG